MLREVDIVECYNCGNPDADEACARCDNWICEQCLREHEGELVCPPCYELIHEEMEDFELSDINEVEEGEPN